MVPPGQASVGTLQYTWLPVSSVSRVQSVQTKMPAGAPLSKSCSYIIASWRSASTSGVAVAGGVAGAARVAVVLGVEVGGGVAASPHEAVIARMDRLMK